MPTRKNGTVKWFNPDKGYGFIKPEDGGPDVFVHVTELRAAGIKSLSEGERVSFELESNKGKQAAVSLQAA